MSGQWGPPPGGQQPGPYQQPPQQPPQYPQQGGFVPQPPPPRGPGGPGGPPQGGGFGGGGWGTPPPGGPGGPGGRPGSPWGPPPRRRGSNGPVIALVAILGGGLVLAVLIGVMVALAGGDDDYTSYTPTYSATPYTPPTYSSPDPSTTPWTPTPEESTPEEATPEPEETETTPPKPDGPPPQTVLKQNKLYSAGPMRSVGCREASSPPSSQANVRAYYNQIFGCLNRAWAPLVKRAGYEFRAPEVIMWTGSVETPCGDYVRAFYCGTNETIYMKWDDDVNQYNKFPEQYQKVYARMFTTFQSSHEYGHHVQWLTGIGPAYNQMWDQTSNYDAQLELSRRLELQASCFAGVFDGANQPTYPITGEARYQWMYLVDHYGDEYGERRDHGSRKNHGPWSKGAFKSEDPKSCNTWSASSARVS